MPDFKSCCADLSCSVSGEAAGVHGGRTLRHLASLHDSLQTNVQSCLRCCRSLAGSCLVRGGRCLVAGCCIIRLWNAHDPLTGTL